MREITTQEITSFISKSLISKLRNDSRKNRIASEGDLQSATYFHLRKFLRRDNKWVISNKLTVGNRRGAKIYPDLVISKLNLKLQPRIAIELKEKKSYNHGVVKKDLTKLGKFKSKVHLKAGFLIYLCRNRFSEKQMRLKYQSLAGEGYGKQLYLQLINSLEKMPAREYEVWKKRNDQLSRLINR